MTTTVDTLVSDYLARLDRAAAALAPERRVELLGEIGEHIASARAAGAAADEAAVRTLLDRLGSPEEIVAAARDDGATEVSSPQVVAQQPGTGLELAAVLMLTVGSLLPVVGWLIGVVLLWASSRWRVREKLLGTLVVPLGPGGVLYAGALLVLPFGRSTSSCTVTAGPAGVPVEVCTTTGPPGWVSPVLTLLLVAAPVVVAVVLMRIARRRAADEPPALVAAHGPARTASPWGGLEVAGVLVLGLGGLVVPVVGPLVGLVLVCCSTRWTVVEKCVAGALGALPLLVLVSGLLMARVSL